jgi:hypothetical protein
VVPIDNGSMICNFAQRLHDRIAHVGVGANRTAALLEENMVDMSSIVEAIAEQVAARVKSELEQRAWSNRGSST